MRDDDLIWRLRARAAPDDGWVYVHVLLEFQSGVVRRMAEGRTEGLEFDRRFLERLATRRTERFARVRRTDSQDSSVRS